MSVELKSVRNANLPVAAMPHVPQTEPISPVELNAIVVVSFGYLDNSVASFV